MEEELDEAKMEQYRKLLNAVEVYTGILKERSDV